MDEKKVEEEKLMTPSTLRTETTKIVAAHRVVEDLRKSVSGLANAEEADVARDGVDVDELLKGFTPKQRTAIEQKAYAKGLRKALAVINTKHEGLTATLEELRRQQRLAPSYKKAKASKNGAG